MQPTAIDERIRLAVVFLQFDRQKYTLALEKLVGLLAGLESVDFQLVVVDNANPGFWQHQLSDHIVQVGGDNSAWEFSAFDRGVAFLAEEQRPADIYAFVTDAFLAYGEDYLELIDHAVLRYCLELRSCVGWVDSFGTDLAACGYGYRDWMRTSFFFLPAELLPAITPLTTPLEPEIIFGPSAATPFSESAPLNDPLRDHLLAWLTQGETDVALSEVWHSQLVLTDNTFDLFKGKVCAILREQLLSARLQSLGIPCYDFRLVRKLARANVDPSATSELEKTRWRWLAGRDAEIEKQPRHFLDNYVAPRATVHGHPSQLRLAGWAVTEPQTREVRVQLGDHEIGAVCDIPRPDAIALWPEYANELCGFELSANLDGLAPGTYEVVWSVRGFELSETLGKIDVLPRSEFKAERCFVPDSAFPGQRIPVAVDGELECSYPLRGVSVSWDGQKRDLAVEFFQSHRRPNGLYVYNVGILGEIEFAEAGLQHRLELEFECENSLRYTWRHFQAVAVEQTRPHTLAFKGTGQLDPRSESVLIHIQGAVLVDDPGDRLTLLWEGRVVYEEKLEVLANLRGPVAWFELRRLIKKIPAGTWDFSLGLTKSGGPPEIFARWRDQVELMEPVIHMEFLETRLPEGRVSPYLLGISGWVEHHELVEHLLLKLDGEVVATLAISQLREDIAEHFGDTLVKRQGFHADVVLDVAPGDHELQLVTLQRNGTEGTWDTTLDLEDASPGGFLAKSATLTDLEMGDEIAFWSVIAVAGEVLHKIGDVTASLYVDGEVVDRQAVGATGDFALSHVPAASGSYGVRVLFQAEGRALYDSGVVAASFVRFEIPPEVPGILDRFMKRFGIRRHLKLGRTKDLVHTLAQREREGLPELFDLLHRIDVLLANELPGRGSQARIDAGDTSSLKVLFACWEVPSSRHGGGVWMSHLLKELEGRHEITLIHAYSPGEEGWVDEVRPYVSKVISVPRMHQPTLYRGDSRIPAEYYDNYTPGLRAAIEAEIFAGDYDVVDYEYVKMYPHMSKADVAQVASILENNFLACLTRLSGTTARGADPVDRFSDLLKNFYFLTTSLPRACGEIIAITEEDAEIVSSFQQDARVYVNTIGVDTSFDVPEEVIRPERQTLVFLGNYRHPPNVEAALFFVEKVMPDLRKRCSDFDFLIIGSHPSDELKKLDRLDDVRVTGFVEEHRPYLFAGTAFVAPIFTGAGMRVKVLEAMACAIPVIGTGLSMNGIGGIDGEHYYRAEDAAGFVDAAEKCLRFPEAAKRIGQQGRELILERHSYAQRAREREAIWRQAVDRWRQTGGRKAEEAQPQLSLVRGTPEPS